MGSYSSCDRIAGEHRYPGIVTCNIGEPQQKLWMTTTEVPPWNCQK